MVLKSKAAQTCRSSNVLALVADLIVTSRRMHELVVVWRNGVTGALGEAAAEMTLRLDTARARTHTHSRRSNAATASSLIFVMGQNGAT